MSIRPGESGCLTKRTSIKIKTMQGKIRTMPRGIEMRELPFNRMRLLKNPIRGEIFSVDFARSSNFGIAAAEGKRFFTL